MKLIVYPEGGLGNLLFQVFNGQSLSKKYNCKVYYYNNYKYWRGNISNFKIFSNLNFTNDIDNTNNIDYNEINYCYNEIVLTNNNYSIEDYYQSYNYNIKGYYQSYKYSQDYIDEIKSLLFNNINDIFNKINNYYLSIKQNNNTCLIHVRRGDYLKVSDIHPICPDEYYINAIKLIPNCLYLILSDDPNIANWDVLKNINHIIINLNDPEELLVFMSLCDNFIIANSSLSLSAYLLRQNKKAKLVAPKNWFGPKLNIKYNINDLIPPNGIII